MSLFFLKVNKAGYIKNMDSNDKQNKMALVQAHQDMVRMLDFDELDVKTAMILMASLEIIENKLGEIPELRGNV